MDKHRHELTIRSDTRGQRILLDDFELKFVTEYQLKSSASGTTELSLKMLVVEPDVQIDTVYGQDGEIIERQVRT